jgi:GT2 family glycosyltransferase
MDNASTDNSVAFVSKHYPDVTIVQNEDNLGYAKAHNLGIRLTRGRYYMPLNPDVVLERGFVAEMVRGFEKDSTVGSVTGKVYFMEGEGQSRKLYTTGHLLTKNRKPTNRGYKKIDVGQYQQSDYVFGVNGACPLLKRAMLEDVAMDGEYFDETFFLYGDDYDLGWRAQLFGWKALYVPTAIAHHHGQGSGGLDSPYVQFQYARNRWIEIYKNDFFFHLILDLPYILVYELLWQGYIFLSDPRRFLQHLKAIVDFIRLLPLTHEKRKKIHARRQVTSSYIRSLFTGMVLR